MPVYSLCTTSRRSRRLLSLARLPRRLKFVPLGLFWAMTAGVVGLLDLFIVFSGDLDEPVKWIDVLLRLPLLLTDSRTLLMAFGPMACTALVAVFFGSKMLKRELSSRQWIANWIITGSVSCGVGVALFVLVFSFGSVVWMIWIEPPPPLPSKVEYVVVPSTVTKVIDSIKSLYPTAIITLMIGIVVAIEVAVVALLLAPLSLLARRLILRRRPITVPAGGISRTQP